MDDKSYSSAGKGHNEDGDKALWELLEKARKTGAGPMFSRNVLREIRQSGEESPRWHWLIDAFRKPALLVAAAAVLLLSGIIILQNQPNSNTVEAQITEFEGVEAFDPAAEFVSIDTLGELMAVSDPGSLSDEALMNLLF